MTEDTHSTTNLLAQDLHRARCRLRSRSAATWTASVWAFQAYVMWLIADSLSFPLSPTSLGLILLASISLATAGAVELLHDGDVEQLGFVLVAQVACIDQDASQQQPPEQWL